MPDIKLVRIKPNSPRAVHVVQGYHFRKADGWCRVPAHIADLCAVEVLHDMNPDASPLIFDVMDQEVAAARAEAEKRLVEPAGTPEKPKEIRQNVEAPQTQPARTSEDAARADAARALSAREREIAVREAELEERARELQRQEEALRNRRDEPKPAEAEKASKRKSKPAEAETPAEAIEEKK